LELNQQETTGWESIDYGRKKRPELLKFRETLRFSACCGEHEFEKMRGEGRQCHWQLKAAASATRHLKAHAHLLSQLASKGGGCHSGDSLHRSSRAMSKSCDSRHDDDWLWGIDSIQADFRLESISHCEAACSRDRVSYSPLVGLSEAKRKLLGFEFSIFQMGFPDYVDSSCT